MDALAREALAAQRETLGDQHPSTLASINNLGLLLQAKGELGEAVALFREALAASRETLGDRHLLTLVLQMNLGVLLLATKGEQSDAETLLRSALAGFTESLGTDAHPRVWRVMRCLAAALLAGEAAAAVAVGEALCRGPLAGQTADLGAAHSDTLASAALLGELLQARGAAAEAEVAMRSALAGRRAALGGRHPDTAASAHALGCLLLATGDGDSGSEGAAEAGEEARALLQEALAARQAALGDAHPDTAATAAALRRAAGDGRRNRN